jgi:hypothetical protein
MYETMIKENDNWEVIEMTKKKMRAIKRTVKAQHARVNKEILISTIR